MSAPCLCTYFTHLLHLLHKYNAWLGDVSHIISRSKGKRSRSHQWFKFFAMCAAWLCLFHQFTSYVAQHKYNRWCDVPHTISRSAGWMLRWHDFNFFCCVCSVALSLCDRFVSNVAQIQPMRDNVFSTISRSNGQRSRPLSANGWYGY